MAEYYKSLRIIDGKTIWVIVDMCGYIINRNPTKDELKSIEKQLLSFHGILKLPEDEKKKHLLQLLMYFYEKEGRPPTQKDFAYNSRFPSDTTYKRVFGSWSNALKLVGLDVDAIVRKGIIKTESQKGRLSEILVKEHFIEINNVIDLSGNNCRSPYDGKCPKDQTYDVKSTKFTKRNSWSFSIHNTQKYEIEWYYLLAFDENYSELIHAWRIPAEDFIEDIEKGWITISINNNRNKNNIESMIQYEITERIKLIFKNWLNNVQKY